MPFDPKLVYPDQPPLAPSGELDLPDDLAALGQQLADDAAHLTACYPPPGSTPRVRATTTRLGVAALALSCTAVAATVLAITYWQSGPATIATRDAVTTALPAAADHSVATLSTSPSSSVTPTSGANATISLSELSGPELEALVDLMQHNSNQALSVAF